MLTRNLVDELIYSEKGNEVLFIKYLKYAAALRAAGANRFGCPLVLFPANKRRIIEPEGGYANGYG
jgi:hypothetical protein